MPLKIAYVSDIHLEFRGNTFTNIIRMKADVLCLAGDICACGNKKDYSVFVDFLKYICPRFKYVIHVSGNHEYYTAGEKTISKWNTMQEIDKRFKALEKQIPHYIYLNCQAVKLTINAHPYIFIGATLWAHIALKDYRSVQEGMNDYNYIYVLKNGVPARLTVPDMQRIHKRHVAFIAEAVRRFKNYPCVVITHHKPIEDSEVKDILTQAYETDITHIIGMKGSNVKCAIHGHTHKHYNKVINGIKYVSNPKGYIGQRTRYVDNLVVVI